MTILVTGASGHVGRAVLNQLLAAGADVRASSRDPRTAQLPAGVPVVAADLTRPETLPAALAGVTPVFLYAQPEAIDSFVQAAQAAGVEQVVFLSSASLVEPGAADDPIAQHHRAVEQALERSGLAWTFVRPGAFATNALQWARAIRAEGVVRPLPAGGERPDPRGRHRRRGRRCSDQRYPPQRGPPPHRARVAHPGAAGHAHRRGDRARGPVRGADARSGPYRDGPFHAATVRRRAAAHVGRDRRRAGHHQRRRRADHRPSGAQLCHLGTRSRRRFPPMIALPRTSTAVRHAQRRMSWSRHHRDT